MGLLDRRVVAEAGLLDLMLLRDCDYFIGMSAASKACQQLVKLDRRVVASGVCVCVCVCVCTDCDYFTGQFSSAFSLMALELSAAEKGYVKYQ